MSTGVICSGPQRGYASGGRCSGPASPETHLCTGCTHVAKTMGHEVRRLTTSELMFPPSRRSRMWGAEGRRAEIRAKLGGYEPW